VIVIVLNVFMLFDHFNLVPLFKESLSWVL